TGPPCCLQPDRDGPARSRVPGTDPMHAPTDVAATRTRTWWTNRASGGGTAPAEHILDKTWLRLADPNRPLGSRAHPDHMRSGLNSSMRPGTGQAAGVLAILPISARAAVPQMTRAVVQRQCGRRPALEGVRS